PRPCAGVPTAIKELHAVAGQQFTMSSNIYGDYRVNYDSYAVRRVRNAGFVLVGRSAAPEFGITPTTSPKRFGHTRNPWDTDRTPGGSSGGAAAAVAAGAPPPPQPAAGGGPIRHPAAGFRPGGAEARPGPRSPRPHPGRPFA